MFNRQALVISTALLTSLTLFSLTSAAEPTNMTSDELAGYQYIINNTRPGVTYRLDLQHDQQKKLVTGKLAQANKSPSNSPQIHASVANAANMKLNRLGTNSPMIVHDAASDTPQDLNIISNFNEVDSANTYTASALSSVIGGTKSTTIKLDLINLQNATVYKTVTQTQYAQGTHFEVTLPPTTVPKDTQLDVVATITYVPNTDVSDTAQSYVARASQMEIPTQACMTAPNFCKKASNGNCITPPQYDTSCTNELVKPAPISICYARGSQASCDYFNRTPAHPSTFVFPTAGNAKFATQPVSPASGTLTAQLEDPSRGGACILDLSENMEPSQWSVDTSTNTIAWNMSPISINDPTRCLNYMNGRKINFYFFAEMELDGTTPSGQKKRGRFSFTSDPNQSGQPGIYIVPQLNILQGCIAEGTQILLASSKQKQKTIESFTADQTEKVKNGSNKARTVISTSKGKEMHPMVRIKTRNHELLITETHPVAVNNNFVMAMDLKTGDVVKTSSGNQTITSVNREKYDGHVYNLQVGDMDDAKAGHSTFYANGILVGDAKTQAYYEQKESQMRSSDPQHVLKRLPQNWHKDYQHHIATTR